MTTIQTTATETGLEANDNQVNDNQLGASSSGEAKPKTISPGQVESRPGQEGPQYRRDIAPKPPEVPNVTPHNPDTSTVASKPRQQQMQQATPAPHAGNNQNKTKAGNSTRDIGGKARNRSGSESNRERED